MMSKAEIKYIADYALENEDNLKIALMIASAYNEIKKRIITNFLEDLENHMKGSLDNKWIITNDLKQNVFDIYKGFYISKNEWEDDYYIGIETQAYNAKGFIIGVGKNEKISPIKGSKLKSLLDERYKPGKVSEWWEWYQWVEVNYQAWDEEVLIKMKFSNEVVNYFKEQILRIKEIATPLIDEAVKAK